MDMAVAAEIDRRAWAVEQAVLAVCRSEIASADTFVLDVADRFLTYLHKPLVEADATLLQAARDYNGTQDAGNLIGLLADALERR